MNSKETNKNPAQEGIFDARQLGAPKMLILGVQHMFAMFGATVLVPALTGLSVSATLFFAGVGTLLFHLLSKGVVPAFLGSSFAFLAGYWAIAPEGEAELLPYACFGVACAGLLYLILAGLIRAFGIGRVMRFFPPIVTGPIIIAIGLNLSKSAVDNCSSNWWIALVAILVVVIANIWGKGMIRIIPIILGVTVSYAAAAVTGNVDFTAVKEAAWIGLPFHWDSTVFGILPEADPSLLITAAVTIIPIALATMIEHIGDMSAISSTVGRNYIANPGLHRTLLGDGLATILASLFGAPANTTYGENTGVLSLTKVYDPRVIRLAATMGGVSLVLYGMISGVGVRNLIENKVDFAKSRNIIIAALTLVLSIGINYSTVGAVSFGAGSLTISLSGLAVGALTGILLNAVLPGKDYVFAEDDATALPK